MSCTNPNPKAIVVSVVAQAVLGALWYSPLLFAGVWFAAQGKSPESLQPSAIPFVLNLVYSIAYTVVLAKILSLKNVSSASKGAAIGAVTATAFVGLSLATHNSFLQISSIVIAIDVAKEIVMGVMTGAILGAMRT